MSDSSQPEPCVLLTGMGGVLGAGLARGGFAALAGRVVLAGRFRPPAWGAAEFFESDLSEQGSLRALIERVQPTAVLHAAAIARMDRCEQEPALAHRLHVGAIEEGMQALRESGGRWVTVSTDQVFDGLASTYPEDAATCPIHAYGRSKAEGENATLRHAGLVVRLPLLLGPPVSGRRVRMGADHVLLAAAKSGQAWQLFEDEWRAPADPADFAAALARLLDPQSSPSASGVYHLAGATAVDRFTLGEQACRAAGVEFVHQRARLSDWQGVPRPPRLILTCERASRELGYRPPDLRQSLARSAAAALEQADGQEK